MNVEIEIEMPGLVSFQREWMEDEHQIIAVEGCTSSGKTFVHIPWFVAQAHQPSARGDEYWWVGPSIDKAKEVFQDIVRGLEEVGAAQEYEINRSLRTITTPQGGTMIFKTGEKVGLLYGTRNVRLIVVDEFTRCRHGIWVPLKTVMDKTGCPIRFIGNYTGDDTEWHRWIEVMKDSPKFKYYRTTALEVVSSGLRSQQWLDDARIEMPEPVFNALYLCIGSSDPSLLVTYAQVADMFTNEHVLPGQPALTCDIALHGSDRFVMGLWSGMILQEVTVMEKKSAPDVTAIIQGKALEHAVPRSRIVYDADGLGAYLKGYLQGASPYQGGTVSIPQAGQKLSYHNLRSQCHFMAADAIREGKMWIKHHLHREEIERETFACLRTNGQNAALQWGIYPKDHPTMGAKTRLGRSPDLFDIIPMRFFLELTPQPKFAEGLASSAKRVTIRPRPKHEGNTNFGGR